MDFIEGLPKFGGKNVIMVIVDRLTKYSHFLALVHPFTAQTVAQLFLDNIFKLHGVPTAIVTDRDRIFTRKLWQDLFKSMKVSLQYSIAYHPQRDGQTERVNQCLENYLRCRIFLEPKKWSSWLPLAEWWYNTTFHASLKCTPFEALYGYPPPILFEVLVPGPESPIVDFLRQRQLMINKLKDNLAKAQAQMKKYADSKRLEREFIVRDIVYLKLQSFRHTTINLHQNLKLATKFYGPFKIIEKIGSTAYKLQLPSSADIHPMFHISQLKKDLGPRAIPQDNIPLVNPDGYIKIEPVIVLDTRTLPRQDEIITQWKVQWQNLSPDQATWEDKLFIKATFPSFYYKTPQDWWTSTHSYGQEQSQGGGNCHTLCPGDDPVKINTRKNGEHIISEKGS
jgi:hypothetical protein